MDDESEEDYFYSDDCDGCPRSCRKYEHSKENAVAELLFDRFFSEVSEDKERKKCYKSEPEADRSLEEESVSDVAAGEVGVDEGIVGCWWFGADGAFEGEGIESEKFESIGHDVDEESSQYSSSDTEDDQLFIGIENVLIFFSKEEER